MPHAPAIVRTSLAIALGCLFVANVASAQDDPQRSLDLTIGGFGLSIGDSRRHNGLRLNYRDSRLEQANGINATIWRPYESGHGTITGLALGIPVTGGRYINGVLVGVFGAEVIDRFEGIAVNGLGMGIGGSARGLMINGLGIGAGGNLEGLIVGGLGAGAGGSVRGAMIGGLGAGVGGNVRGLALGLLGVGAGGRIDGLAVGGLGVGAGGGGRGALIGGLGAGLGGPFEGLMVGGLGAGGGGSFRGLGIGGLGLGLGGSFSGIAIGGLGAGVGGHASGFMVGGLGLGVGGDATGVFVSGIGMGAGGTIRWFTLNGVGVGAQHIQGVAIAGGVVTTPDARGLMVAGLWQRIRVYNERTAIEEARLEGVGISAFNQVLGFQKGLTIGIINYARSLDGVQLGLLNIVRDNPAGRKVLPIVNWGSR